MTTRKRMDSGIFCVGGSKNGNTKKQLRTTVKAQARDDGHLN